MKRLPDCVVGLRGSNAGSGVGLFNALLAQRLGGRYVLLDDYAFAGAEVPLLSLKFEELDLPSRQRLTRELAARGPARPFMLYLHTLDHSEAEGVAVRAASRVLCGNDAIHRALSARGGAGVLVRAFAPGLLPDGYERTYQPRGVGCFSFGMAGKVDERRFARLRDLLDEAGRDYQLLCSLAIHQTSDGSCLPRSLDFFRRCFGERFVHLGTLTDEGVAYLLNHCPVFVGFYRGGVRGNNTTFNTALRFGNRIITNLDEHSPDEVRGLDHILDLDAADAAALRDFLGAAAPRRAGGLFSWEALIECCFADTAGSKAA